MTFPSDERKQNVEELKEEFKRLLQIEKNMLRLLRNINGNRVSNCRGSSCGKTIYWVQHHNGARTPYDQDGTPHHATCEAVEEFRRRRNAEQ